MPDTTRGAQAPAIALPLVSQRDARLDVFRGLALVTIFINHVPGTVFEHFTSRNFGFSDAAEAFVLMSGVSAGLAYGTQFRKPPLWPAVARVWGRAWTLYLVHIAITFMAIAICAAAAQYFGLFSMIQRNNLGPLFRNPLDVLVGLPTLGHQLGYFNILPLYIVLLLGTPLFFLIGLRRPWLLVALSGVLWFLAGQWRLNMPAFPNPGGWFFNPFSWQFLFVIGLCTGVAAKEGRRLVPMIPAALHVALAFVLIALLWVRLPDVGAAGRAIMASLRDFGTPFFIAGFDKTFLGLPRLLHVLALFYIVTAFPIVRALCHSRWLWPLDVMGRQALPVFAMGSVLAILMQAAKLWFPVGTGTDAFLIGSGLLAQLLLAMLCDWSAQQRRR